MEAKGREERENKMEEKEVEGERMLALSCSTFEPQLHGYGGGATPLAKTFAIRIVRSVISSCSRH